MWYWLLLISNLKSQTHNRSKLSHCTEACRSKSGSYRITWKRI